MQSKLPTPLSKPSAPFVVHVARIIGKRADEKMLRIGAFWVIAFMQNAHALWNWSVVNLPRGTVGWYFLVRLKSALDHSITKWVFGSGPFPAFRSLYDLCPEPIRQRATRFAFYGHKALYPYQIGECNG